MHSVKLAKSIFLLSIKEALAYRVGMLMTLVTFPILLIIYYFVWLSIFGVSETDTIAGYTFEQMVSYYIITLAMLTLIWNPIIHELHQGVRQGDFIRFVVKPLSYPFYGVIHSIGGRSLAFVLEFAPLMIFMGMLFGSSFVLTGNLLLFLCAVVIAFVLFHLLSLLMGSLVFWLTNPNGITWFQQVLRFIFAGGLLPLTFFPEVMHKFLLFIPFPYFNFIPATIFVGNTSFAGVEFTYTTLLFYGGIQILALGMVVFFVWRAAIKNFQGVGA